MLRTRLAICLVVVTLVAGACSKRTPESAGSPSPTLTSPTAVSPSPDVSASVSAGPRARPGDRTPAGRVAPPPPPPGQASQSTPPTPGTYRYAQSGEAKLGTISYAPDPEGTLTVERARIDGNGQSQRHIRTISERNEITSVYRFTSGAVLLTYISQSGVECAPEPALTAVKLPLKVDATWTSSGRCGDLTADLRGKVVAEETLTVGGEKVETFQINLASEIRSTGFFQTTGIKAWLSPAHRLVVRSEEASQGMFSGAHFESTLKAQIVDLQPA